MSETRVCAVTDVPEGEAYRVVLDGLPISVWHVEGAFYAIDDTCTHQDASLADGWLEGCAVECPLHASMFDLRTGAVSGPPAQTPVRTHAVFVKDGAVYVSPGTPASLTDSSTGQVGR
ncbi:bifunctional 3-phenylpropionate/cinnamic acid dioxygenase ferredoxin subunit [Spongisporangium articulatum]|uniref:Bifunctional 3-phenylpropionate/cinnamic acid dioxygenase ferredoxin subunit n=1 Tax=Spongisporangium articulatum TaxID=3362603 RepID=A0ABW8AL82_9ACTN